MINKPCMECMHFENFKQNGVWVCGCKYFTYNYKDGKMEYMNSYDYEMKTKGGIDCKYMQKYKHKD